MWAHFEVRQFQVDAARKVLGWAIGSTKKKNVFKGYVELEMSLGEVTRARKLYEKYAEEHPQVCSVWTGFAQLETM
jgi:crooked neck